MLYALRAQGLATYSVGTFVECPQVALLHEVDKAEILLIDKLFYFFAGKLFKSS